MRDDMQLDKAERLISVGNIPEAVTILKAATPSDRRNRLLERARYQHKQSRRRRAETFAEPQSMPSQRTRLASGAGVFLGLLIIMGIISAAHVVCAYLLIGYGYDAVMVTAAAAVLMIVSVAMLGVMVRSPFVGATMLFVLLAFGGGTFGYAQAQYIQQIEQYAAAIIIWDEMLNGIVGDMASESIRDTSGAIIDTLELSEGMANTLERLYFDYQNAPPMPPPGLDALFGGG